MATGTQEAPTLTRDQVQAILVGPLEQASVFLASGPRIFDTDGNPVRVPKLTGVTLDRDGATGHGADLHPPDPQGLVQRLSLRVVDGQGCVLGLHGPGKEVAVLHLGDHDASGVLAAQKVNQRLDELLDEEWGSFTRLAITRQQINAWDLPTRPGKESTHSRGFEGPSVELDAVDSNTLRTLLDEQISALVDEDALRGIRAAEESEREHLLSIAAAAR